MNPKMTLILENGLSKECDIVARWNDSGNHYVAYTDGTMTNDELDLFVSKYEMNGDEFKLIPIDDEEEWQKANKFLDEYFYEDGDINV